MTTYWISNTCALTNSINIFPFGNDINENFNALARLIIFATIMALVILDDYNPDNILLFGSSALVLSIIIYFLINRIFVNLSREEMVYYIPRIIEPKLDNQKGVNTYENISSTKKEHGLKNADYTSFYKISQSKF